MSSLYARGNKLWCRLKDESGEWVSKPTPFTVDDRRKAKAYVERAQRNIDARRGTGTAAPVLDTVRAYALGTWIDQRQTDDLDWKNDRGRLTHHVLPRIGDMKLADVRTKHLADLVRAIRTTPSKETGEPLSQRSVYNIWSVVSALFRDAAVAGLIDSNPCHDIGVGQLGQMADKDPEWRAGAVFTRAEAEILISHADIPFDRRLYYAFLLLAGMRPGEIAARRWRDYDAAVEPLGKLTIASAFSTPKNKFKATKTNTTKIIPVHATLGAMLAEWKLSGWARMMSRSPGPDDLILPLPPADAANRTSRDGEAVRTGDYAARRWRDDDLAMLGWRHRRLYDGKATMITLALDDGADETLIRERVTHAKPVKNAFDHYYRGTKWLRTCEEISKLRIVRRAATEVIALPVTVGGSGAVATPLATGAQMLSDVAMLSGAGEGIRTLDVNLGKVALYH